MKTNKLTKTFTLGKIDGYGNGRKNCLVTVDVTLYKYESPDYWAFTASAMVWDHTKSDIIMGGQCLDELNETSIRHHELWGTIYEFWKKYHLNDMKAGTPEQQKAIDNWLAEGNQYDYDKVCDYLKSIGLYEVTYTGKACGKYYNHEPYKYGHGWIVNEIPEDDLEKIKALLSK